MSNEIVQFDNRADWLEGRRTMGIGSSDAPAVLGISRYKSSYQLFNEKLGLMPASRGETELIEWGNILEEPIAQRYAQETNRPVTNPNATPNGRRYTVFRSREVDFMLAQVDRITEKSPNDVGVLEIKNAHFYTGKSWLDINEPPLEFIVQLQHQLAVTGYQWGSIAALIGGCRFVWTDLARDDEFIELLMRAEEEFWQRLQQKEAPDPDGSERTRAAIGNLFKELDGTIIGLPTEAIDWDMQLTAAKKAEKIAIELKTEAENKLKVAIGNHTGGRLADGTLYTWKTQTRKAHSVKESTFRVLRAFAPKGRPELAAAGSIVPFDVATGGGDDE